MIELVGECAAADAGAIDKAYGEGFADACNDVIPELLDALGAFLSTGREADLATVRATYEKARPQ